MIADSKRQTKSTDKREIGTLWRVGNAIGKNDEQIKHIL